MKAAKPSPVAPKLLPRQPAFVTTAWMLMRALTAVLPARGRDRTRPTLCAVFVTVEKVSVMMEATDGHRLHRVRFNAFAENLGQYRLPSVRALDLLARAERRDPARHMKVALRPRDPDELPKAEKFAALGTPRDPARRVGFLDLNPTYIAEAASAAAGFGCLQTKFTAFGDDDPITIEGESAFIEGAFTAIVMPMKRKEARALSPSEKAMISVGIPVVLNPEAIGNPNLTPIVQLPGKPETNG